MKKNRRLAWLLLVVMVFSLFPTAAFAEETEEHDHDYVEEVVEPSEPSVVSEAEPAAAEPESEPEPEAPAEEPAEEPAEPEAEPEATEASIEEPAEEPAEEPVEQPAEPEAEPEAPAVDDAVAAVEALIDALPDVDAVSADDYDAAQAAADAFYALSEAQQEQVANLAKLIALMEWFNAQTETLGDHDYDAEGFCTLHDNCYQSAGLKDGYYEISNAGQLYWFAQYVNDGKHNHEDAKLMNDITVNADVNVSDTSSLRKWTPIGSSSLEFRGKFDGQGHSISGLYCVDGDYLGLFGCVEYDSDNNTCVKDVTVKDSHFGGGSFVGAVAGYCAATNGTVTVISNCHNSGTAVSGTGTQVGGVVGSCYSSITGCTNSGSVSSDGGKVGGVVGEIGRMNVSVTKCSNSGTVTSAGTSSIGGVVGVMDNTGITVQYCCNTGAVTSTAESESGSAYVGGVVGRVNEDGKVEGCYSTGTVSGGVASYSGGVAGYKESDATVTSCYYQSGTAEHLYGYSQNRDPKYCDDNAMTAEQFKSGEVAYKLNGDQTNIVWKQTCGTGLPTLTGGGTVYKQIAYTTGEAAYTNSAESEHSYGADGICSTHTDCAAKYQPATLNDGVYEISNAGQLFWFAGLVNGTLGGTAKSDAKAKLTADIDLGSYEWTPIGSNSDGAFTGTFDGDGHTVSGLYINCTSVSKGQYYYAGLFGCLGSGATVENVTVAKNSSGRGSITVSIDKFIRAGAIAGNADGATVKNCHSSIPVTVNNTSTSGSSGKDLYAGGIVGNGNSITITGCSNSGAISATGVDNDIVYAGGIAGFCGSISKCWNTGAVTSSVAGNPSYTGGIAGKATTVSDSYSTGEVTATASTATPNLFCGGVAGYVGNEIKSCYSSAKVTATRTDGNYTTCRGGLAGMVETRITNCVCLNADDSSYGAVGSGTSTKNGVTPLSADDFKSGKATWLLNGSTAEGDLVWKQTINGTNLPGFTGKTVCYNASKEKYYNPCEIHSWSTDGSGVCTFCDEKCSHKDSSGYLCDENGKCTACGYQFSVRLVDKTYEGAEKIAWGSTIEGAIENLPSDLATLPSTATSVYEVTLYGDVTEDHSTGGSNYTLELNGHEFNGTLTVVNGGLENPMQTVLAVKDSSAAKTGAVTKLDISGLDYQHGKIALEGGRYGEIYRGESGDLRHTFAGTLASGYVYQSTAEGGEVYKISELDAKDSIQNVAVVMCAEHKYTSSHYCDYCSQPCSHKDAEGKPAFENKDGEYICTICKYKCGHWDNGKSTVSDSDGKCTVCGKPFALTVKNDYTGVVTASDTITDGLAEGDHVKLFADVTYSFNLRIQTNNVTIDLNGHTLSGNRNATWDYRVQINAEGVTLKNGTVDALSLQARCTIGDEEKYPTLTGLTVTGPTELACDPCTGCSLLNSCEGTVFQGGIETTASGKTLADYCVGSSGIEAAFAKVDGDTTTLVDNYVTELSGPVKLVSHSSHTFNKEEATGKCACGATCAHTDFDSATGYCTDCGKLVAVFRVGSGEAARYYKTFGDAYNATQVEGADTTVTMVGDYEPATMEVGYVNANVTFDLNGHMADLALQVDNGVELTVLDSSDAKNGRITSLQLLSSGKATLSGGTYGTLGGTQGADLSTLLASGYAYQNADGDMIKLSDIGIVQANVKVVECEDHSMDGVTCVYCGSHVHCVCGASHTAVGDHKTASLQVYTPWSKADSLPTEAGHYYLTVDVTFTTGWKPADGTVLCLNGHSITMNGDGSVIEVPVGKTFTLTDCTGAGKITHGDFTGCGVAVNATGIFNMYGGSITGNTSEGNGGGVRAYGACNLYGGSITGNTVTHTTGNECYGGGVYADTGRLNLYGTTVSGNVQRTTSDPDTGEGDIEVGGQLTVPGGEVNEDDDLYLERTSKTTVTGGTVGKLYFHKQYTDATLTLKGGSYAEIQVSGTKLGDCLASGYAYKDTSGAFITRPDNGTQILKVSVAKCAAHSWNSDAGGVCTYCGTKCTHKENNEYTYDGNGKCTICGAQFPVKHETASGAVTWHTNLISARNEGAGTVTLYGDLVDTVTVLTPGLTLDLNGHAVSGNIKVTGYGNLTVKDSSAAGTGAIRGTVTVNGSSTSPTALTVEGGTIDILWVQTISDVTLKGGTYTAVKIKTAENQDVIDSEYHMMVLPELLGDGYAYSLNKALDGSTPAGIQNWNGYSAKDFTDTTYFDGVTFSVVRHLTHSYVDGKCACGYACPHTNVTTNGVGEYECNDCGLTMVALVTNGEGEEKYFASAVSAADSLSGASTLKLLAVCTEEVRLPVGCAATVDLNGQSLNSLEVTGGDANVAVTDSGTGGYIAILTPSGTTKLSGGSYGTIKNASIALLAEGYAFRHDTDDDKSFLKISEVTGGSDLTNVKVVLCTEHNLDENGKCQYCGHTFTVEVTCGTDVTYYDSFADAVEKFNSYYLPDMKLYGDCETGDATFTKAGTLDLNGHTLTGSLTLNSTSPDNLGVEGSGTITGDVAVKGSAGFVLTGGETQTLSGTLTVSENASVTLNNAKATVTKLAVQGGTATVRVGTVTTMEVSGGKATVTGGTVGTMNVTGGKTEISGGNVTTRLTIGADAEATLSGGTFGSLYSDEAHRWSVYLAAGKAYYIGSSSVKWYDGKNISVSDLTVQVLDAPITAASLTIDKTTATYGETDESKLPTLTASATVNAGLTVHYSFEYINSADADSTDWSQWMSIDSDGATASFKNILPGEYTVACEIKCDSFRVYAMCDQTITVEKGTLTAEDFTFTLPSNLTYTGNNKRANVTDKPTGAGNVTVKYFSADGAGVGNAQDAGTYTVRIDVGESSRYKAASDLTADTWTFTIAQADQTLTVPTGESAKTVTRGQSADISAWATATGVKNGSAAGAVSYSLNDAPEGVTLSDNRLTVEKSVAAGTTITVTATAAETKNYKPATQTFTVTVGKSEQTVTAADVTVTYGDEGRSVSATGIGAVTYAVTTGSDVVTVDETTGALTILKAGTATVTATAAGDENNKSGTATITVTVNPKTITAEMVTVSGGTYTGLSQGPKVTVTGLTKGTDYTLSEDTSKKSADTYYVTVNGEGNYTGEVREKWVIAPARLSVAEVTIGEKTYDGTATATVSSVTFNGLVNGETLAKGTGGYTVSAAFDDANAGTDKTVTATVTLENTNYAFTGEAENVTMEATSQTKATIMPMSVTADITVDDKDYDGTTTATVTATVDADDLIAGDSITIGGLTGNFVDAKVGNGKTVDIDQTKVSITGTNSVNYNVRISATATGNIVNNFTPAEDTEYTASVPNGNGWLKDDLTVTAEDDYELSLTDTVDGTWGNTLTGAVESADSSLTFYVRNQTTGAISQPVTISYKLDKNTGTAGTTGSVAFNERTPWQSFLSTISFNLFYKSEVTVKATANDGLSGVEKIEYAASDKALTLEQVKAITDWTAMPESGVGVTVEDTKQFVYFIRVTDYAGNISYFSTDGAEYDTTLPAIDGIENGATYYTTQIVTVTDRNLDSVTLNGVPQTVTNGAVTLTLTGNAVAPYTVVPSDAANGAAGTADATHTIVATDKAGNVTEYAVTMKPTSALTEDIDDLTEANVTSADREDIEAAIAAIEDNLANPDATEEEKEQLTAAKEAAEKLLERIDAAAGATATETIKAVESITAENAKTKDKSALEAAKAELEKALEDFGDNLTEAEKTVIHEAIKRIEAALKAIEQLERAAKDKKAARTGDSAMPVLYIVVIVIALGAIAVLVVVKKKKQK